MGYVSMGEADGRKLAGRLPGQKARQPSARKNLDQLTHRRGPPASQTYTLQLTPPSLRHRAGQGAPGWGVTSRRSVPGPVPLPVPVGAVSSARSQNAARRLGAPRPSWELLMMRAETWVDYAHPQ